MRWSWLILIAGSALSAGAADPTTTNLSFAAAQVGKLPEGWSAAKTGEGDGSVWKIVADDTVPGGKALAQTSAAGPDSLFNLCAADKTSYADIDLTISLKAIAGKLDQGGGPIWRYQDANNYYLARVNPLENNFRDYKVVDGKRTQLGTAEVKAPTDKWHTLRVVQTGKHVQCFFNGKLLIEFDDETFAGAGKVGLWTKSDAQTRFTVGKVLGN